MIFSELRELSKRGQLAPWHEIARRLLGCVNRKTRMEGHTMNTRNTPPGTLPRFRVEERSGIVAVYDTQHPEYQDTPGCHSDFPWCVASWHGEYHSESRCWKVEQWKLEKAHALVGTLNATQKRASE